MPATPGEAPRFSDSKHAGAIRDVLAAVNYTDVAINELMGCPDVSELSVKERSQQLKLTGGGSPLETLVRLFLIGVPVERGAVVAAVAPSEVDAWVEAGLLREDDGQVFATINILPFKGILLAYDTRASLASGRTDFVMGLGKSSLMLANLTVRQPSRRTLDLGAGGGFQALAAAGHSQHVVATDRNPRAVQMAAFNAALNGLDNIEAIEGDLFEPVGGQQFDLVVTNPPFVISPESQYIYRDSGLKGDEVCEKIVRHVPGFLHDGGYCVMLCNWIHFKGQPWEQRLAGWCEDSGCDVLVLRSDTTSHEEYARTWIKHTELHDAEHFDQRLTRWTAYYEGLGIDQISAGVIVIRRNSGGPAWFETEDRPEKMLGPCGQEIVDRFEVGAYLNARPDDEDVLNDSPRIHPDARLHHQCQPAARRGLGDLGTGADQGQGFRTQCQDRPGDG